MYYYNYDLATNYELVNVFKLHNVLLLCPFRTLPVEYFVI